MKNNQHLPQPSFPKEKPLKKHHQVHNPLFSYYQDSLNHAIYSDHQTSAILEKMECFFDSPRIKELYLSFEFTKKAQAKRIAQLMKKNGIKKSAFDQSLLALEKEAHTILQKTIKDPKRKEEELLQLIQKIIHYQMGVYSALMVLSNIIHFTEAHELFAIGIAEMEEKRQELEEIT